MKFNLKYHLIGGKVCEAQGVHFEGPGYFEGQCQTAGDVRVWLNQHMGFMNVGNRIINLNNVTDIEIEISRD